MHPPGEMPFLVPWTDAIGSPGFVEGFVGFHLGLLRDWRPDNWMLDLGVWCDGEPIGFQGLEWRALRRDARVVTGSWLGERHQGRGFGTEMRGAVLELAFAGLGARIAKSGARGVQRPVGARLREARLRRAGEDWVEPRGEPIRQVLFELPAARCGAARPSRSRSPASSRASRSSAGVRQLASGRIGLRRDSRRLASSAGVEVRSRRLACQSPPSPVAMPPGSSAMASGRARARTRSAASARGARRGRRSARGSSDGPVSRPGRARLRSA